MGRIVKHGLAGVAAGIGLALSAIPALMLLPICLIPVSISAVIGLAGFLHWSKKADKVGGDTNLVEGALATGSICIPIVVFGICFAPAILIGSPGYITAGVIERIPSVTSKKTKKTLLF